MSEDITEVPNLRTVCEILVDDYNATYIAAAENSLANQCVELLFHTPPGSPNDSEVDGGFSDWPETVEVDDFNLPTALYDVLHSEVHAFRRVPLYVHSQPGMNDVSLDEGIEKAQQIIVGEVEPAPSPSKSIELPTLIEELADAGATAVELYNEQLILSDNINLRIPITPAEGYQIAGPYDSVTLQGQEYDFRFNCVLTGPGGYGPMRTPLYVDGSTLGLTPVSVEEGLNNLKKVQTIVEESDSPSKVFDELRSSQLFSEY